jgi:tetratricopeptide (TPR) repeat protein
MPVHEFRVCAPRRLARRACPYGRDHANVATTLGNLGNAYGSLGDHAKKRDMQERALAIFERAYGRDHANVAIALTNLGEACGGLGDTVEALEYLQRALVVFERNFGSDHPYIVENQRIAASLS